MAVHMVRILVENDQAALETPINNWVSNHNEWTADPVSHSLSETNTDPDGSGAAYLRGDWRFVQEGTATALLDDLEQRLSNIGDGLWYRIGYHVCTHDEDNPEGCSFEQTREGGTVPAEIPQIA